MDELTDQYRYGVRRSGGTGDQREQHLFLLSHVSKAKRWSNGERSRVPFAENVKSAGPEKTKIRSGADGNRLVEAFNPRWKDWSVEM